MPIYDYRCDHCGHAFSAVQSFKDDALAACPSCGKHPRRLITLPAIVFKGSGWYKTDSRGPAPAAKDGTASKEGTESKDVPGTKAGSGAKDGSGDAADKKPAPAKTGETTS
ncbi:MAG TPA: FmdB family zinc ribbon protein [Candidatus Limnocylindria bacterium]